MGWTVEVTEEHPDKYIICLAPHTSNWDFILGLLYSRSIGMKSNFLMKKEWFFWPLGPIFRSLGGIPVYRQKKMSMTDAMAETAKAADTFHLCITPEGTRSRTADWKKGFYFIALKANSLSCSTASTMNRSASNAPRPSSRQATLTGT